MYRAKDNGRSSLRAVRRSDAAVGHDPGRARGRRCARRSPATSCASSASRSSRPTPDSIRGFEALVRWERPGFGLVAPDEFIADRRRDRPHRRHRRVGARPGVPPRGRRGRSAGPSGASASRSTSRAANSLTGDIVDVGRGARSRAPVSTRHAHARAHREHAHRRHDQRAGDPARAARPRRQPRRSTTSAPATRRSRTCARSRSTS